jgi:hypothetical protein
VPGGIDLPTNISASVMFPVLYVVSIAIYL